VKLMGRHKTEAFDDRGQREAPDLHELTEDEPMLTLVSESDILDQIFIAACGQKYKVVPRPGGAWGNFEVFYKVQPDILGLKFDPTFWYWGRIDPGTPTGKYFMTECQEAAEALLQANKANKSYCSKVYALYGELSNGEAKTNGKSRISSIMLSRATGIEDNTKTTVKSQSGNYRFVPEAHTFPEAVRKLTVDDLLPTFHDSAEREAFMLVLGRAALASRWGGVVECPRWSPESRHFAVLFGDRRNGKSFLLAMVDNAMSMLGYAVRSINPDLNTKFGWGAVASSNMSYLSDMDKMALQSIMGGSKGGNAVRFLTLASNDKLVVEEKGQPAVEVKASTTMFFVTNDISTDALLSANQGMRDRACFLRTKSKEEISEQYNLPDVSNANLKTMWENVLEDIHFDEQYHLLTCWLIRMAVDRYLEVSGFTWSDDDGYYDYNRRDNKYHNVMDDIKGRLYQPSDIAYPRELAEVSMRALAAAIACKAPKEGKVRQEYMNVARKTPWTWHILGNAVASHFCRELESIPGLKITAIEGVDHRLRESFIETFKKCKMDNTSPLVNKFEKLVGTLTTNRHWQYPKAPSHYSGAYNEELMKLEYMVNRYAPQIESLYPEGLPPALDSIITFIISNASNRPGDLSSALTESYSPQF